MCKRLGMVLVLGVVGFCWLGGSGQGQEDNPTDKVKQQVLALSQRIDDLLEAAAKKAGITPAPLAPDTTYFRRLNLDLTGKIPTLLDIRDFLENDDPNKRWMWTERFLESDSFGRHFANIWRRFIIGASNNPQVAGLIPSFEIWLKQHLQGNEGYDKLVRDLLTSGGPNPNAFAASRATGGMMAGSPQAFYFANENKAENLAGAAARAFLGVKLECAQCHAHPFAKWSREQFWEFAAFFPAVRQNPVPGGVPQPNIPDSRSILIPGTNKTVKARFLDGVEPAWKAEDSTRQVLADWLVSPKNPYFAKAAVDRLWQYFFAMSLMEPILEPSEDYLVTHPALLDELAREFMEHKYDLRFIIRAIVNTKAYQRSSAAYAGAGKDDHFFFARMPVRGLTAEQVFDSFWEATTDPTDPKPPTLQPVFFNQPSNPRSDFLIKFESAEKQHETSILQALFLMNGKFVNERANPYLNKSLNTIATCSDPKGLAATPTGRRIETLFLLTLNRYPRREEIERLSPYIDSGGPTRDIRKAIADVYWALLNSGEFLLNH